MSILTELTQEEAASYSAAAEAEYAVFLSFRGEDTRLSFTDHLYQALLDANIPTFLDEEEVETGEDLKPELAKAIRNSRASIIVLSQNYASSRWCLDELVMILEQRRTSNHIVLPIFYNIDPSHVRKQQGSFGDALVEHKRKLEAEKDPEKKRQGARKLVSWTEGLAEVADLKGMNATGRRETVFIKEIVKEISSKLELHLQSKVPDLIGMDDSISFIDSWLKEGPSETADLLTIGGMAGIGKTTLAKYIYMLHYRHFEGYCFLENIERNYAEKSSALLDLQKRLLEDILKKKSKVEVRDVNECIGKIQEALLNKCTLVVLDDVGDVEQLNMLIGTKGFHPGSKIIITTKDMSLTKKYCALFCTSFPLKLTMHELSCLSDAESLRLFCRHAFGGHSGPKEGYEEEATNFVKYCGGHPLALKVLGSSLLGKDVGKWRDVFEMLKTKELLAIKRIQNILRVSFDCLSSINCQELFKHIACFFVGEDRKATELILNECGIHVSYGITELIDRCLLTIGDGNKLKMHQLLQEIGRDLVHQESPDEPWKRSRLWNHEESLKLLKDDKGTEKIQGLFLDMKMLERQWVRGSSSATEHKFRDDLVLDKKIKLRTDVLKKMDGLNLLQLNHVKLKGSYMNFPKGLRSLCMHGFRMKHIPSELPTENLVALDMSYSDLKQLWKKPKLLGSLKILNLSYCKLVSVGGFSKLPALEILILKGCASLILVSESIGECDRLVSLDMSYCRKLKKIPSSIHKLKKLESLRIDGCVGAREFLIKMKDMQSLKAGSTCIKTHASSSSIIKLITPRSPKPFLLSLSQSLVELSLRGNNLFNESFRTDFSSLSLLKVLCLDGNPIDSMPDCVRSLSRLEFLSVTGCHMLKSILRPPNTLKILYSHRCSSLEKITFSQEIMPTIPLVWYTENQSLTEVHGLFKIQDLAQIDEEILCRLGWRNLGYAKDQQLQIYDSLLRFVVQKRPVQMYYEFGIFSTCFLGKEVPDWFGHRSKGSSISFTIPSSPTDRRIQGLNICFVHTFSGSTEVLSFLGTKVSNVTKNRTWIYYGFICVDREGDEDIVWLSHWMLGNEEFEDGDEVSVTVAEEEDEFMVRECAISPVYDDGVKEEDPLGYYKSWKNVIGGDLSRFQLTSGDYFLIQDRFIYGGCAFQELFEQKTIQSLVGYKGEYPDANPHPPPWAMF